jgi:predicted ATPase
MPKAAEIGSAAVRPPTTLHGRADDLAMLRDLLRAHRLVTLVGAGGIGKTALAAACVVTSGAGEASAASAPVWVDLAPIGDPALVPSAVMRALGLPSGASDEPTRAVVAALAGRSGLVVLDNAEHVIDGVAGLADAIVRGAAGTRLLVTSQAPLKLEGEQVFRLGPLSVPAAGLATEAATRHGAVALFVEQVAAADRRFVPDPASIAIVGRICRQLDGVALAIKLAAARVPHLGLAGVEARLDERLKLLVGATRGAPARQQTLLAALDWSHALLAPGEPVVLRRLALFRGSFTLDAASALAAGTDGDGFDEWAVIDALGALVDRSWIGVEGSLDLPRYRLHGSAREYALGKLAEAGEREAFTRRHAEVIATRMEDAYERYWATPDAAWLARWAPELDDVRAAVDGWAASDPALARRLLGASSVLFLLLGLAAEWRRRAARVAGAERDADANRHIERDGDIERDVDEDDDGGRDHDRRRHRDGIGASAATPADGRFWLEASRLHWGVSMPRMAATAEHALTIARALADRRATYLALRCAVASVGETAADAGAAAAEATAMLAEMAALEDPSWPTRLRAQRRFAEAAERRTHGDADGVAAAWDALHALARDGGYASIAAAALAGRAEIALERGDAAGAVASAMPLIETRGQRPDNFILRALATLAQVRLEQRDLGAARAALADFIQTSRRRDWEWFDLHAADLGAELAAQEGRSDDALRLLAHAEACRERLGPRGAAARRLRDATASRLAALAAVEPAPAGRREPSSPLDAEQVAALALARGSDAP